MAGVQYRVEITGLVGGHSGAEIYKNRSNANILMGRLLHGLNLRMDYALAELEGGSKDNAITRNCAAEIVIDGAEESVMQEYLQELQGQLRGEYCGSDDGITINVQKLGSGAAPALNPASMQKVLFFLMNLPNGVQKMSAQIPGLVETSLNLGILKLEPDCLTAVSSVRSSVGSAKDALGERLEYLTEFLGGEYHAEGAYPAWEYRADTPLQKLAVSAYEELFGKMPKVEAIHAGLECGLFYEKIPGLDSISFGPDMKDIHTTEEKLSISSTYLSVSAENPGKDPIIEIYHSAEKSGSRKRQGNEKSGIFFRSHSYIEWMEGWNDAQTGTGGCFSCGACGLYASAAFSLDPGNLWNAVGRCL